MAEVVGLVKKAIPHLRTTMLLLTVNNDDTIVDR
jgi:hypothetical protein